MPSPSLFQQHNGSSTGGSSVRGSGLMLRKRRPNWIDAPDDSFFLVSRETRCANQPRCPFQQYFQWHRTHLKPKLVVPCSLRDTEIHFCVLSFGQLYSGLYIEPRDQFHRKQQGRHTPCQKTALTLFFDDWHLQRLSPEMA